MDGHETHPRFHQRDLEIKEIGIWERGGEASSGINRNEAAIRRSKMAMLRVEDHDRLSREHYRFAKEEMARRQKAPILVTAEEIESQYRERGRLYIVDPRIGFNHRTFRFWIGSILPTHQIKKPRTLGHRHNIEAVIYILQGHGYSVIDGVRHDWEAGDFICVPNFAWHRHVNTSDQIMIYVAATTGPLGMALGSAIYEDDRFPDQWVFAQLGEESLKTLIPGGESAASPPAEKQKATPLSDMDALYGEQLSFAVAEEKVRRASRVTVKGKDIKLEKTRMGHLAYVVDPKVGFHTRVLGTLLAEVPPGCHSGAHRHLYEEINYVLRGEGYTIIDDRKVEWKAGAALCIPVFGWHQHFNTGGVGARFLVHHNRPFMENLGNMFVQHGEAASGLEAGVDNSLEFPMLRGLIVDPDKIRRRSEGRNDE
jgi:gentisate 1,2-dioxygenase